MEYDWENNVRTCQSGQTMFTLQGTKIYNTMYVSRNEQETTFQIFPVQPIETPFKSEHTSFGLNLPQYILIDNMHVS